MTSRSLRNLPITAPSSERGLTTNNPRSPRRAPGRLIDRSTRSWLRRALFFSLSVSLAQEVKAQQGWTPQPFVPPTSIQPLGNSAEPPPNRLRGEKPADSTAPVVLRWRSSNKATPSSEMQVSTSAGKTQFTPPTTAPNSNPQPAANWSNRSQSSTEVSFAQFELPSTNASPSGVTDPRGLQVPSFEPPPTIQPPPATEPPATNTLPNNPPSVPGNNRSLLDGNRPEELFDRPSVPPNPFPAPTPRESRELLPTEEPTTPPPSESPSDREPPSLEGFGRPSPGTSESELTKPGAMPLKDVRCDSVRQRAYSANIDSIDLDVAPSFSIGAKVDGTPEEKKAQFAKSAPIRNWHRQNGEWLAEGKLVDIEHHLVVVEDADGSRSKIRLRDLSDTDQTYVSEKWGLPITCSVTGQEIAQRAYEPSTVAWKASGLCHKPLYFEEIQLERSGHEYGPVIQPALSTVHFFKNIAFLPYKMGIHPLNECQYPLGHYRPGNCAPWSIEPIPLSLQGFANQAKVITGGVLALP